jgi:tRNA-specific 2-thiouridylase
MSSWLVAMSGGVDSSVAAALLRAEGHEVVGVTMKLWGGASDTGCCSVADVDDARRVAQQLDIEHLVFNFTDDFDARVVGPYVDAHRRGRTPNPCIECNRHLKFDRLLVRADALGFEGIATGHHCRVLLRDGRRHVARGADRAKDQSYVAHMLDQEQLERVCFPVGAYTKDEVRRLASELGLRTAAKPDSQDVCFITSTGGRAAFLGERMSTRPGEVVDDTGRVVGHVDAVELVTVGQRRALGGSGGTARRFVTNVDIDACVVTVGDASALDVERFELDGLVWSGEPVSGDVLVQCSAHGAVHLGRVRANTVEWGAPRRRVAPGQSVVLYDVDDEIVVGGAFAA